VKSMIRSQAAVMAVLVTLGLGMLHAPGGIKAQTTAAPPEPTKAFPVVSMAIGQTVQVNVAQVGNPNIYPAGSSCRFAIDLFSATGNLLVPESLGQVEPGKTTFVSLNRNSLPSTSSVAINRVAVRALVRFAEDPNEDPDPCREIRTSVEVYDNLTGRTAVLFGDPAGS
jgi:hypothetical protein